MIRLPDSVKSHPSGGPELPRAHALFGAMSAAGWHRWAYRHTDHHLRQFGR